MEFRLPEDLRYAKTDEWVRIEEGVAVVGITDYAQDALSDVVYVELPGVGEHYAQGEEFGQIESVKAAAALNAPVSGSVVAVNEAMLDAPEQVNSDPYGAAWLIKLQPSGDLEAELAGLMDAAAYNEDIQARDH